jgi:hypothetical protein
MRIHMQENKNKTPVMSKKMHASDALFSGKSMKRQTTSYRLSWGLPQARTKTLWSLTQSAWRLTEGISISSVTFINFSLGKYGLKCCFLPGPGGTVLRGLGVTWGRICNFTDFLSKMQITLVGDGRLREIMQKTRSVPSILQDTLISLPICCFL